MLSVTGGHFPISRTKVTLTDFLSFTSTETYKATGYLTSIFNASIYKGKFPKPWKHAEFIVFHKHGNRNHPHLVIGQLVYFV